MDQTDDRDGPRPVAVIETTRPLRVAQVPIGLARSLNALTFSGFDTIRRWRWRCFACNLGSTHGFWTAARAADDARQHLADEHPRDNVPTTPDAPTED